MYLLKYTCSNNFNAVFYIQGDEIKQNAAQYLIQISTILNRVPRQMLLILKTNDVLRGIECALKTRANASSFINMSKCCVRAVAMDKLCKCDYWFQSLSVKLLCQWQLFKISLYEFYLWLQTSALMNMIHNKQIGATAVS